MMRPTYLSVTTTTSAQKMSDSAPYTAKGAGTAPPAASADSRIA